VDAWVNRNRRKAGEDAGVLTFYRDGMLENLQVIAEKKATARTFGALKRQYEKSALGVDKTRTRLIRARDKLAGTAVAEQIDGILHSDSGKMTIREEIEQLLRAWDLAKSLPPDHPHLEMTWRNMADDADHICKSIELFNANVRRLHRMVSDA
jgi:hypothetical protein